MVVVFVVSGRFYRVVILLEVVFVNVKCVVVGVGCGVGVGVVVLGGWFYRSRRGRRCRRRVSFFFDWEGWFNVDVIFIISGIGFYLFYVDIVFFFLVWIL